MESVAVVCHPDLCESQLAEFGSTLCRKRTHSHPPILVDFFIMVSSFALWPIVSCLFSHSVIKMIYSAIFSIKNVKKIKEVMLNIPGFEVKRPSSYEG